MKHLLGYFLLSFAICYGYGQIDSLSVQNNDKSDPIKTSNDDNPQPLFRLNKPVDIPIIIGGTGWSVYALTKIYNKNPSTLEQIQNLRVDDISRFNRWAATEYSKKAADLSNVFFYGSMPLPLLLLADKKVRNDLGMVSTLYLEAFSITGLIYTGSVYFVDKYRPLAYNPSVSMDLIIRGGAKNSFFAGHVALVGTSTFFMATIYSNYHPGSKLNWIFYSAASAATLATAYLRFKGGQHFPSDILIGTAVGTLSGILVPNLHKNRKSIHPHLSLTPVIGPAHGITAIYKF